MLRAFLAMAIAFACGSVSFAQSPVLKANRIPSSAILKANESSSILASPLQAKKSAEIALLMRVNRRGPARADLAVTYLTKGLAGPTHDPRYAYLYGRVKNLGSLTSPGGLAYEFRQNGVVLKRGTMPAVAPGQEISLSHNFPGLNMPAGAVTLQIYTNDNGANNSMTVVP